MPIHQLRYLLEGNSLSTENLSKATSSKNAYKQNGKFSCFSFRGCAIHSPSVISHRHVSSGGLLYPEDSGV